MSGDDSGQAGAQASGGSGGTGGGAVDIGGTEGGAGADGAGGADGTHEDPNKVVLFDGSPETFNKWVSVRSGGNNPWRNNGDGTMTVQTGTGDIQTMETFGDVFVHVEYMIPTIASVADGSERGNSGVFLKGSYELQILDTYGLPPATDGCGAIHGIAPPLEVACFDQEEWNVYEIEFKAQSCNDQGEKAANARFVEVKLNGMVVQRDVDVPGTTLAGLPESCEPRGLLLQDHSSIVPVSFRNIWVIPRN